MRLSEKTRETKMQIRKAEKADLENILAIYKKARAFMAANGNPNQWGNNKPAKEQIEAMSAFQKSA